MGLAEFGLSIIPPLVAMLVEALNPVSRAVIKASAKRDFHNMGQDWGKLSQEYLEAQKKYNFGSKYPPVSPDEIAEQFVQLATLFGEGAVEVSGAAVTIVSVVSSGFAVLHDTADPFWWAIGYVLGFIAITLIFLSIVGGYSFVQISSPEFGIKAFGGRSRKRLAACVVYVANSVLILTSTVVFVWSAHLWSRLIVEIHCWFN